MTSLCPRCSTPRASDYPLCQACGFDFRTLAYQGVPPGAPGSPYGAAAPGSPYGTPPPPPPPVSSVCPRCHAPLYPGYTRCGNCGFDSAQPWGAVAPAARPAGSNMPLLLAIAGVVLLAGAGALVVVANSKGGSATASPNASVVAQASPTLTPIAIPTSTPAPTSTVKATHTAAASPTQAAGTPEPSPLSAWTTFTAPDGKWSVKFPGTTTPIKQTMALNSGIATGDMSMYIVGEGSTAYAVVYFDFPSGTIPATSSSFLQLMESSMMSSVGGTLVSSSDATVGPYAARDMTIEKTGQTVDLRVWFVADRFYMLMVMGPDGATVYPQHFMSTVVIN